MERIRAMQRAIAEEQKTVIAMDGMYAGFAGVINRSLPCQQQTPEIRAIIFYRPKNLVLLLVFDQTYVWRRQQCLIRSVKVG